MRRARKIAAPPTNKDNPLVVGQLAEASTGDMEAPGMEKARASAAAVKPTTSKVKKTANDTLDDDPALITPTAPRIATRQSNAVKHPGLVLQKYKQKRRTKEEMDKAHQQVVEEREEKEKKRQASIVEIAQLEDKLIEGEEFGATPRATTPKYLRLRRTNQRSHLESQKNNVSSDDETNAGNHDERMEVDESGNGSGDEFVPSVRDEESELTDLGDLEVTRPKKRAKTSNSMELNGFEEVQEQDIEAHNPKGKKKEKAPKLKVRDAVQIARDEIARKRKELEELEKMMDSDHHHQINQQTPGILASASADQARYAFGLNHPNVHT